MKGDVILVLTLCFVVSEGAKSLLDAVPRKDPDEDKNATELIKSKGYPVEEYSVQTSDGYILSMQRIPYGKRNSPCPGNTKVILLIHGLFASSDTFVLNFPNQSLGFILADSGYDVWLGNTRGNSYSRKHVKYTPDDVEFWNFSFTEVGLYDLPAMIDYVLAFTGVGKLYYIGHSQGTAAAFVMLSERREYNDKIQVFICMAPVAFVGHLKGPLRALAPFTNEFYFLFKTFGYKEFLRNDEDTKRFKRLFCNPLDPMVCDDIFFAIFASDKKEMNETRVPVYVSRLPAGTSTKSVAHFGQLINSKEFRMFDYFENNVDYYGQETPPNFDVSLITAPVALLRGPNDNFATPEDIDILRPKLKSVILNYNVPDRRFNHIDFIFAIDAFRLLYKKIIWLINRY